MRIYSVAENGPLHEKSKINFNETKVYLIDDIKNIYIWLGNKASNNKKRFSERRANDLNKRREKPSKIIPINQGKEFGPFLAIMDLLKRGMNEDDGNFQRPELKIRYKDTVELIDAGIDPDFEGKITLDAHAQKSKNLTYEELCTKLAKIQLKILNRGQKITDKEIKEKSQEIFKSSSTYDELCWLIAELTDLLKKKEFEN
jgi:hypothetical protein